MSFSAYLIEAGQTDFGKHVKATMASDEAYRILDSHKATRGSTWNAGGCAILAHAIHRHLPGSKLMDVYNKKKGTTEHVTVHHEDQVYDGRGSSSKKGFLTRYAKHELLNVNDLEFRDHDRTQTGSIPIVDPLVDKTHKLLQK